MTERSANRNRRGKQATQASLAGHVVAPPKPGRICRRSPVPCARADRASGLLTHLDQLTRLIPARPWRLNHFALRNLELSDDGVLVDAVDSGPTSARQLDGSERSKDHELKRADAGRMLYCHNDPPATTIPSITSPKTTAINAMTRILRRTAMSSRRPRAHQAAQRSSNSGSMTCADAGNDGPLDGRGTVCKLVDSTAIVNPHRKALVRARARAA